MRKMFTGPMQFTPYRPWSEDRKAAARARNGPVKNWTEEEDGKILELLANGQTRKQIAAHFGVTRNAICGRVHRLARPSTPNAETVAALQELEANGGELYDGTTEGTFDTILADRPAVILASHELEALRWFREREPTAFLDVLGERPPFIVFPTERMRAHLCTIGVLEKVAVLGLYRFQTTEAGRAALDLAAAPS